MRMKAMLASAALTLALASTSFAGSVLYGTTGNGSTTSTLYQIDATTGAGTAIGSVGYTVNGLEWDATTGTLYGTTSTDLLITINTSTGAATVIGNTGAGGSAVVCLTSNSSGDLYGWWEPNSDDLATVNKSTGAAAIVGDSGLDTGALGLAFDASDTLWLVNYAGQVYTINASTGAATYVRTLDNSQRAHHGDFNPDNGLYYGINATSGARSLIVADLSTGSWTSIRTIDGLHTLTFAGAAVPLPPAALMGLGLLGVLGVARRRRKRSA